MKKVVFALLICIGLAQSTHAQSESTAAGPLKNGQLVDPDHPDQSNDRYSCDVRKAVTIKILNKLCNLQSISYTVVLPPQHTQKDFQNAAKLASIEFDSNCKEMKLADVTKAQADEILKRYLYFRSEASCQMDFAGKVDYFKKAADAMGVLSLIGNYNQGSGLSSAATSGANIVGYESRMVVPNSLHAVPIPIKTESQAITGEVRAGQ